MPKFSLLQNRLLKPCENQENFLKHLKRKNNFSSSIVDFSGRSEAYEHGNGNGNGNQFELDNAYTPFICMHLCINLGFMRVLSVLSLYIRVYVCVRLHIHTCSVYLCVNLGLHFHS